MKNTILLLGVFSLAACTPTYDDLSQWMTQTRADAKKHIIPFEEPTVTPPKAYIPPSYSGPNAFDSRRLQNLTVRTKVLSYTIYFYCPQTNPAICHNNDF